jgi:hypothetical protein
MALANYSDLQATVANYLGRSDLTSQIVDFISFAENRLSRELRTREMLKYAEATMTPGDDRLSLPNDFLELRNIHVDTNPVTPMQYLSPATFFNDGNTKISGIPTRYTILSSEFKFAPVPQSDYTAIMLYYARPNPLAVSNPTNIFLTKYPDALLYATQKEAETYIMNDPRIQTWAALYDRAVANIQSSDDNGEYSGVPLVMSLSPKGY